MVNVSTTASVRAIAVFVSCVMTVLLAHAGDVSLNVELAWRYKTAGGACEIAAYSPAAKRLFVTVDGGVDVVSAQSGSKADEIAAPDGFHATSVACAGDVVAVAWAAADKRERGRISFYGVAGLEEIADYDAGYLPDMITFTADGTTLLVANEGEPTDDYSFDPDGSISIINRGSDWSHAETREATFTKFNPDRAVLIERGLHISGPNADDPEGLATVAADIEPEFITVSDDLRTAWITLQENNAIAELDIEAGEITRIYPLGLKSFRALARFSRSRLVSVSPSAGLDASDRDGGVRIRHWPIWGLYQPDGIVAFRHKRDHYLVTANEGDPRDYIDFEEAVRVSRLEKAGIELDPSNPARHLVSEDQLGRLKVSRFAGDTDGDGDLDRLICFGGRSFSIWKCTGRKLRLVYDSGGELEQKIAEIAPDLFNVDSKSDSVADKRSPVRGPEPENLVLFEVGRRRLVAIGLERTGGAMIYDISDPEAPKFLKYLRPDESGGSRDLAPEGLVAIPSAKSSSGNPMLIICNEGSGTMTAWEIRL